jgi:hypothetical protein
MRHPHPGIEGDPQAKMRWRVTRTAIAKRDFKKEEEETT